MADWRLAPALITLRAEVDRKWPNRSKASDGTIGDAAHAARESQHNPSTDTSKGIPPRTVTAIDITVKGIDVNALLKATIGASRVWYVIYDRKIYSRTNGWKAQAYTGSNPHTVHVHISLVQTGKATEDASGWGIAGKASTNPAGSRDGLAVAYAAIVQTGQTDWNERVMLMIAGAESSWKHAAISGTADYGMWQINKKAWGYLFKTWAWDDPWQNAEMAHIVWKAQGYNAWVAYKTGAHRRYADAVDAFLAARPDPVTRVPAPVGGPAGESNSDGDYSGTVRTHADRWKAHGQKMDGLHNAVRGL